MLTPPIACVISSLISSCSASCSTTDKFRSCTSLEISCPRSTLVKSIGGWKLFFVKSGMGSHQQVHLQAFFLHLYKSLFGYSLFVDTWISAISSHLQNLIAYRLHETWFELLVEDVICERCEIKSETGNMR